MGENAIIQPVAEPNTANQSSSVPNAVIQPVVEPTTVIQPAAEPNIVNQSVSEPNTANQSSSEPNVENQQVSEPNTNVLKVIRALSQNSALISKSAQSKLSGAFAMSITDLEEPQTFTGKITGHALIVNTFNVRTLKRNISDIKFVEVTTDPQLYANNLPNSCYRTRWTVQMSDNSVGACTAMRGSDAIGLNSDVKVTLSKSSFNNVTFIKSVINKK